MDRDTAVLLAALVTSPAIVNGIMSLLKAVFARMLPRRLTAAEVKFVAASLGVALGGVASMLYAYPKPVSWSAVVVGALVAIAGGGGSKALHDVGVVQSIERRLNDNYCATVTELLNYKGIT